MIPPKSNHSDPANPFRPGMGLDPPYLADRAAQLERFTRYLAAFPSFPRNVRLTGLRGVGKTVLLQHYAAAAEARGWVVARRECSEHLQSESTFALALVADCRAAVEHSSRTLALRQHSTTAARHALDLLGGLTVTLEGVTLAVKPPASAAHHPEVLEDRMFQAVKLACEAAQAAHRPGVLFCYDEAHVLSDTPRRRQFPLGIFLASVARARDEGNAVRVHVAVEEGTRLHQSQSARDHKAGIESPARPHPEAAQLGCSGVDQLLPARCLRPPSDTCASSPGDGSSAGYAVSIVGPTGRSFDGATYHGGGQRTER